MHREAMHNRLHRVVNDALGVTLQLPDGVKLRKADSRHIRTYTGVSKFSDLEDWAMDVCTHLAMCLYGGDRMEQERIFVLPEFLAGEAMGWFRRAVLHVNHVQYDWTFKGVLTRLYDRFVHPSTLQDARRDFQSAKYTEKLGVQGFYDTLNDHAQNMAVYPDGYTMLETFLDGIPADMHRYLIREDGLSPEVNNVEEFVAYAIQYE